MTQVVHQTAGMTGYAQGCRCDGCREAKRQWKRGYAMRRYVAGGRLQIDSALARDRLQWLRDNGVSYNNVAELTGLAVNHVQRIANGRTMSVNRSTEAAIFTISREAVDDNARVDAGLTWRRLHGLMALGWPAQQLAADLGYKPDSRRRTIPLARTRITVAHARAVAALCVTYGNSLGPSQPTKERARREGWVCYGQWDDDLREVTDFVRKTRR